MANSNPPSCTMLTPWLALVGVKFKNNPFIIMEFHSINLEILKVVGGF